MSISKPFYESVEIPKRSIDEYKHAFFLRNFFQKPDLFQSRMKDIEQELVEQLPRLEKDEGEIECFGSNELSIDSLKNLFMEDIRPIVIRGYAKDHDCVRYWSPEYFKEHCGDFKIFYTTTDQIINDNGTCLSDFIDQIVAGSKNRAYVENLSDIFNAFPELHEHLGLDKVAQYLGDYASYHKIAQLFFGGVGTGAVFHCANELNCFLNIYGQKKWKFVHPKYSIAMQSTLMNKGYFVGSFIKHNAPKGYLEAKSPLYNRIPKLTITLEPGDLLLNPPWWWHCITNLTPITIAVATRWRILAEYIRQSPIYDFVQSLRTERLSSFKKELSKQDVVISDQQLRKNYVSYDQMGWNAKKYEA